MTTDAVAQVIEEEIRHHEDRLAVLRDRRNLVVCGSENQEKPPSFLMPDEEIDLSAFLARRRAVHTRASAVIYFMPGIMAPQIRSVLDAWGVPVRGNNGLDKLRASLWKHLDPRGDLVKRDARYFFKSPSARRRFRRNVLNRKS